MTHRHIDIHTDTQTHRHSDSPSDRHTHRHTHRQTHRQTDTQTHAQTQSHRHIDTQTDTQTHRHTDTQTCVALMGNGIKSLFPLMYHRVRISATRINTFGTFLHQHFQFSTLFYFFDIFTCYPLHFYQIISPSTPFILYLFSYILFFSFYFIFLIFSRATTFILFAVSPLLPPSFYGLILSFILCKI